MTVLVKFSEGQMKKPKTLAFFYNFEENFEKLHHRGYAIGGTHPFVGDGFCNAETNNAVCNFDGGDCCGTCVNIKHCSNSSR